MIDRSDWPLPLTALTYGMVTDESLATFFEEGHSRFFEWVRRVYIPEIHDNGFLCHSWFPSYSDVLVALLAYDVSTTSGIMEKASELLDLRGTGSFFETAYSMVNCSLEDYWPVEARHVFCLQVVSYVLRGALSVKDLSAVFDVPLSNRSQLEIELSELGSMSTFGVMSGRFRKKLIHLKVNLTFDALAEA